MMIRQYTKILVHAFNYLIFSLGPFKSENFKEIWAVVLLKCLRLSDRGPIFCLLKCASSVRHFDIGIYLSSLLFYGKVSSSNDESKVERIGWSGGGSWRGGRQCSLFPGGRSYAIRRGDRSTLVGKRWLGVKSFPKGYGDQEDKTQTQGIRQHLSL